MSSRYVEARDSGKLYGTFEMDKYLADDPKFKELMEEWNSPCDGQDLLEVASLFLENWMGCFRDIIFQDEEAYKQPKVVVLKNLSLETLDFKSGRSPESIKIVQHLHERIVTKLKEIDGKMALQCLGWVHFLNETDCEATLWTSDDVQGAVSDPNDPDEDNIGLELELDSEDPD